MLKIGVTGGIGSGKSVVCALFNELGVFVYDSDSKAKELTSSSPVIIDGIKRLFGCNSYLDGILQRKYIASKVFADQSMLAKLNGLIHPVVAEDFQLWCAEREQEGAKYIILESAILIESGFTSHVDVVVSVAAPVETRISRVMNRDSVMQEDVKNRINSQLSDAERSRHSQYTIINDDNNLIMPQIIKVNSIFTYGKI